MFFWGFSDWWGSIDSIIDYYRYSKNKKLYDSYYIANAGREFTFYHTKSSEVPNTHLVDLQKMKGWIDLEATQCFSTLEPWIQYANH